jgi:hypothetical protein
MHKSSTTTTTPCFCLFPTLQPRWKHPNIQDASSFLLLLLLPLPPVPPSPPSSVTVDGGPFLCSLEPPRKYWQSSISLTGRQPLPESRVGGISGFWTAFRRESCEKQGTGGQRNATLHRLFCATLASNKPYLSFQTAYLYFGMSPEPKPKPKDTPRF